LAQLTRRDEHTIAFLRMAAAQMFSLVERAPEIAVELRHMAKQLQSEADDLARPDA
jgi:hypothetical protein